MKCSSPYRRGTWRGALLRLATARRVLSTDQKERHNQSVLPCEHPPVHLTSCPANGLHPSLNPVIRLDFAVAYLPSSLPDALSPSLPRCSPRLRVQYSSPGIATYHRHRISAFDWLQLFSSAKSHHLQRPKLPSTALTYSSRKTSDKLHPRVDHRQPLLFCPVRILLSPTLLLVRRQPSAVTATLWFWVDKSF